MTERSDEELIAEVAQSIKNDPHFCGGAIRERLAKTFGRRPLPSDVMYRVATAIQALK